MRFFLLLILIVLSTTFAQAWKSIPAKYKHELSSTSLTGYKQGEYLINSSIYTGTLGVDASQKYSLDVKVSTWNKSYTTTSSSNNKNSKEVFTVTLYKMKNLKEMKAVFSDTVYDNGQIKLKFAGQTILYRPN